MKGLVLFGLILFSIQSNASNTCDLKKLSKTKHEIQSYETENLAECIALAERILVPEKNQKIKKGKVSYSYYDSKTQIHYKGSLR